MTNKNENKNMERARLNATHNECWGWRGEQERMTQWSVLVHRVEVDTQGTVFCFLSLTTPPPPYPPPERASFPSK